MSEILFYLLSNFWLGVSHAALPGHGKTVAAAYIVGARGRPANAVVLGILVTLSHTSGVVLLFIILALLGSTFRLSELTQTYLALATGLIVVGLGLWMLRGRRDELFRDLGAVSVSHGGPFPLTRDHHHNHEPTHDHDHPPDHEHGAAHDHGHGHAEQHAHTHRHDSPDHTHLSHPHSHPAEPDALAEHDHSHDHDDGIAHGDSHTATHRREHGHAPDAPEQDLGVHSHGWGLRHRHRISGGISVGIDVGAAPGITLAARGRSNLPGLVGLAIADGLLPDPAALGLLVSAMVKGKVLLGLTSVVAYSIGFAAVLALVGGVAVLAGSFVLRWLSSRWITWLPLGAAVLVVGLGIFLTVNAWRQLVALG